ncbi:hypothetical protein [Hyphomicrobium sp. 2TAF46]|uniref:hypothetical protein n=1 Tax=Hyphomicrobium sp. 2TAF46 TaxID=3233019 RepID=UPI003F902D48
MIELFARKPGTIELPDDVTVTKIPVDDDVLSLSAILLEDGYYEALQGAKRDADGVTIIDATMLGPDLSDRDAMLEAIAAVHYASVVASWMEFHQCNNRTHH